MHTAGIIPQTSLCRAVAIPARVVWGCIDVPSGEGSFRHHRWNEVYMGEARWIPLDTTLKEIYLQSLERRRKWVIQ